MEKQPVTNIGYKYTLNLYLQKIIQSFKELHGNPHYLALGIGIGVFVGMTPAFPLHTIIAIPLAHIFRGSKRDCGTCCDRIGAHHKRTKRFKYRRRTDERDRRHAIRLIAT